MGVGYDPLLPQTPAGLLPDKRGAGEAETETTCERDAFVHLSSLCSRRADYLDLREMELRL